MKQARYISLNWEYTFPTPVNKYYCIGFFFVLKENVLKNENREKRGFDEDHRNGNITTFFNKTQFMTHHL